jgi:enoyl-[acyl-carrier protein] reductase II
MAALDGDVEHGKVEAGQSAALVDELVPAAMLVERIMAETCEAVEHIVKQRGQGHG